VTVTIPYPWPIDGGRRTLPYWYDSLTGQMSQQGITDVERVAISPTLHALRFRTTHFTAFYVVAEDSRSGSSAAGAGGGGCSVATTGKGSPRELVLPYAAIATIMVILRRHDKRKQKTLDETPEQTPGPTHSIPT
jgi:hypothetical protein